MKGQLIESDKRADTLAEYLEQVQWEVRPANLTMDKPAIGSLLDVDCSEIKSSEVKNAVKHLKLNKTSGLDEIPAEYFKALCSKAEGLELITKLCQLCWEADLLPE